VSALDEVLAAVQGSGKLPSVTAAVARDGQEAWAGAAGAEDDPDRVYRIGSITKTMTAVLVLQLRDEGRLDIDDPVGRFVPETGYADATLRGLLSHTAGTQSEPVGSWWERSPGFDMPTLLAANDGGGRVAAAGEYYHYSNLGYALLGEAVARLRGASWWDVLRMSVLAPLGMERTTYHPEPPAAQGYSVDHFAGTLCCEPHQDTGAMAPAGQLWSTLGDLALWARFLADGHGDVLSPETLREMSSRAQAGEDYGLGLRRVHQGGRVLVGHGGTMPGFQAGVFVDPKAREGVVVLCNATTGLSYETTPRVFLGGSDGPALPPWVPTERVPAPVEPVLGLWFWGNTAVELRWQNERLELRGLNSAEVSDAFEVQGGRIIGVSGYHRGETLHVHPTHLECATFVYTRTPYDPAAPIPGGPPS
jgi:CubicO group peptidase (beta-lactamase class C family)